MMRKLGQILVLALISTVASAPAAAQSKNEASNYPNRPIKFIVPFSPGGLGDTIARTVGQHLSERLGQPVVIDNRAGASQILGGEATAKAAPDGYTIFMGSQGGLVLNTVAKKNLPYDPVRDFAPISTLLTTPLFLVVHPSLPVKSVKDLITLAKAQPGQLTFASIGKGSAMHLAAEMFKSQADIDILHVPYRGSSQAIMDVTAGRVSMMFEGAVSSMPHVRTGKLRALASSGPKRATALAPGLPTIRETVPEYNFTVWFGLVAPAGTPRPIIDKLNAAVSEVLKLPALRELATLTGTEIIPSTPDELGARIRDEIQQAAKVMRAAGIEPE